MQPAAAASPSSPHHHPCPRHAHPATRLQHQPCTPAHAPHRVLKQRCRVATKDCAPRVSTSACAGETGPRMATPGAVAMVMLLVWSLVLLGPRWFQLRAEAGVRLAEMKVRVPPLLLLLLVT